MNNIFCLGELIELRRVRVICIDLSELEVVKLEAGLDDSACELDSYKETGCTHEQAVFAQSN